MTSFIVILALLSAAHTVAQQTVDEASQNKANIPRSDSVRRGDIDTTIFISARDTVHFSVRKKRMTLLGKAVVTYQQQKLEAARITMDFSSSTMQADGYVDSLGRSRGFPVFTDNGEEFAGESMTYNFRTKRGRVRFGETNVEGGFYYGERIKRVGDRTVYVQDGCFTTCDAPEPHFYFNSPKMKVVMDDKIYLNPVIWYVEDVPVFALPFGVFFSTERGRRSGLIMPTPLITSDRGIVIRNLGYYIAASDYFDTEIAADVTTKGGFTLFNRSRWALRDDFSGNSELVFGYTRFNVDDPYAMNIGVTINHQQQLRPQENIALNLLLTTQQLYQNTSLNPIDRVRQNARSTASYQRTFFDGTTLNLNYVRDQNMVNGSVTENPSISYGIPQWFPLRSSVSGNHWIRDLTFQYRAIGRYYRSAQRLDISQPFTTTEYTLVEHRPSITITPKLGNVTIQPSVVYSENWYGQEYVQSVDNLDSTVRTSRRTGFFREYTYGFGVSASTFLYGMAYPRFLGISAFRHTLQPVLSVNFIPDQSDTSLGFFGKYTSPITGQEVLYRRFSPAGSLASAEQQTNIGISLLNKFSVKPLEREADSVAPRPVDVLVLNLSTSYNVVADSLPLRPITFNVRSPMLEAVEFACSGAFSVYRQALVADPGTGRQVWRDINTLMLSGGGGIARLTQLSLQLGTRFNSDGISFQPRTIVQDTADTTLPEEDLRSRFDRRLNYRDETPDLFADQSNGWQPLSVPWDLSLSLSYNLTVPNPDMRIETLLLSFSGHMNITSSLTISAVGSFDMITATLNSPIIDITKKIHCWNLTLNWVPIGINQGFFLRFSASAPQLQGLVIPKQSTPLYR